MPRREHGSALETTGETLLVWASLRRTLQRHRTAALWRLPRKRRVELDAEGENRCQQHRQGASLRWPSGVSSGLGRGPVSKFPSAKPVIAGKNGLFRPLRGLRPAEGLFASEGLPRRRVPSAFETIW